MGRGCATVRPFQIGLTTSRAPDLSNQAQNRSDAIAADLRDAILRGDPAAGERLPAERELAARLGVGRSSVREAVAKLAQLGLVEIRHGGGAIVRPVEDANVEVLRHLLVFVCTGETMRKSNRLTCVTS